jgi:eukaryotic-like serine/threonine-protein kinase
MSFDARETRTPSLQRSPRDRIPIVTLTPHTSSAAFLGTVPRSVGEERAFFQSRLSAFYRLAFTVRVLQIVIAGAVFAVAGAQGPSDSAINVVDGLKLWAIDALFLSVCFALWRVTRRGELAPTTLLAIDVGGTLVGSLILFVGGWGLPAYFRPYFYQLIAVTLFLAFRAAIVPSTARRTAILGAVPVASIVAYAYFFYAHHYVTEEAPRPGVYAGFVASLGVAWVAVTAIVSHTLFGLRQTVLEVMQLGQYTLEEKIGEGGMGVVYRATHAMLRRPAAIKLLLPDRAQPRDLARFEREVQQTSRLAHPNTISIFDYGRSAEGVFYYVMEYLDGFDLEKLVAWEGPLAPARAIHVLLQASGALAEAHALGLIHRDIKPANIVLTERADESDVVKVVDFGLVKTLDRTTDDVAVTNANTITGTPMYLAPEAITSPDEVDARSDLYALGAVGYYLLTGQHVFEGATVVEVCSKHLLETPIAPSKRLGRSLPQDVEALVVACLAKRREDRPASAQAMRAALLVCADASSYDVGAGRAWWRERGAVLRARRKFAPSGGHATMAVDLHGRAMSRGG